MMKILVPNKIKHIVFSCFYILFLILFNSVDCGSQTNKIIDSLTNIINTDDKISVSEKEKIYNQIAQIYKDISPEKSIEFYNKSLEIAIEQNDLQKQAEVLKKIGTVYLIKLVNYNKALEFYNKALEICKKANDKNVMAACYNNIGVTYNRMGQYDKAIENQLYQLKINEQSGNKKGIAISNSNIGNIYNSLNENDKALEYYQNSLKMSNEINDTNAIANALMNIGVIYQEIDSNTISLEYHYRALNLKRILNDKANVANTLSNIGLIYLNIRQVEQAFDNFSQALEIYREIKNNFGISLSLLNIGSVYVKQNQIKKAKSSFFDALSIAKEIESKPLIQNIYYHLFTLYQDNNTYKEALDYHILYSQVKDSLYTTEIHKQIAELQTKYETEKKENEINNLTKEKEIRGLKISQQESKITQQRIQTYSLIFLLFLLGFSAYLFFTRYKLRQKNFQNELEKNNLKIEQKLLRTQMNPHFIFNSLNSIQSFISENEAFLAESYLSKFARLMRSILDNSRMEFIPIEDDISTLRLYMELEKLRFNNKFDFNIIVDPKIVTDFTLIPPMLIQPFVENAILHGIMYKETKGSIEVIFRQMEHTISCMVKDDGVGREIAMEKKKKNSSKRKSHGLQVTKERLELLNEKRKTNISIKIIDLKDDTGIAMGTQAEVIIPFEES